MKTINSRADIERLPLTEKTAILSRLAATLHALDADGQTVTDTSAIERFGYTLEDFPDAPVAPYIAPVIPAPVHPAVLALQEAEENGINIPFGGGSVRILCGDRDRALLSSALALYRTHEDLLPDEPAKEAFRNSVVTLADADGVTHALTVQQARQLLVVYGATYQAVWAAAAQASQ